MKRRTWSAAIVLLVLSAPCVTSAAAVRIGFTSRLADSGTPVTGSRSFVVSLFDVATGGTAAWTESHTDVAVSDGVAHLVLGSVTALPDALFTDSPLYLAGLPREAEPRSLRLPGRRPGHVVRGGRERERQRGEAPERAGGVLPDAVMGAQPVMKEER
jgi:hypothetical protein